MPIREYDMAIGTNGDSICVRKGIDVVKKCRDNEADPQIFPLFGKTDYSEKGDGRTGNGRWCNSPPAPPEDGGCKNLKVWDCNVLEVAVNPSCSFAVHDDWTKTINADIKDSGGYTVSFWWKAMEGTSWDSINAGQMLAYSSLVPPRVLFALDFFGNGDSINYWIEAYDTCNDALENLNNIDGGEQFVVGSWYFVAIVVGSPAESGDGRSLFVMSGSQPGTQLTMKTSWCSYMPDGEDFIQALTVPGGLVISPIEVTGSALSVKQLQNSYYTAKPQFRLRRGPASLDEDRLQSAIEYETPVAGYPFPTSLVAPPIVLQTRRLRTDQCKYDLGSQYNTKVWETAVDVTCRAPYECSDDLTGSSTSLMACSSDKAPDRFWGRDPIIFNDKLQFYEFLQTIADAPFVERNGSTLETRGFLDAQTETISCLMITYSSEYGACKTVVSCPKHCFRILHQCCEFCFLDLLSLVMTAILRVHQTGIASTIEITGEFAADVKVDFEVTHFQSLEGEQLDQYTTVTIVAFVVSAVILVEKIFTVRNLDWKKVRNGFFVDILIQVFLPIIYFAIRYSQIVQSREQILQTIGNQGLAGVPWSSREVPLLEKVESFLSSIDRLQGLNFMENIMRYFYFVLSAAQLLRLIMQTSAHPRTAILVNTRKLPLPIYLSL